MRFLSSNKSKIWSSAKSLRILAVVLISICSFDAYAGQQPARNIDARDRQDDSARPGVEVLAQVDQFRNTFPDLMVRFNPKTGGVSTLFSPSGPLTAVSNQSPGTIARRFVADHATLFGLKDSDLQESRISRDYGSSISGVTYVTLQQQLNGLDVFGAVMTISVTADGRVLKAGGAMEQGLVHGVLSSTPLVQSPDAVGIAANQAGVGNVLDSNVDGLVYFPVSPSDMRLAWNLQVEDGDTPFVYRTLVDALTGEVLLQYNTTTMDHIPAHGLAYTSDGPRPGTPTSTLGGIVPRDDVPFSGAGVFGHNDPHYDWWDGAPRTTTTSNNVEASEDQNGDGGIGFQPTAMPGEDFSFVLDLSMSPLTENGSVQNVSSAIVNLFYTNNWLHDVLYQYGFDEAASNFQNNNFGLGGVGGDPVRADAQDNALNINNPNPGDNLCNAFFNGCGGDGGNRRMTMLLCDRTTPLLDGDLDNSVIAHEYGHGVHHRIIPTSCSPGYQGMGEGWGDYWAVALFAEPDDDINGQYNVGHWLGNITTMSQNFRRQPYTTDQSVFTRTYANITDGAVCDTKLCSDGANTCSVDSDCNAGQTCDNQSCGFHFDCAVPQQPFALGDCQPETHNTGELWAETLWLARANLVIKYGFNVGSTTMNTLVMEGMKMTNPDPTFLDARDGVLAADLAINAGVNQCLLWDAFASMGLGLSAQTVDKNDINPLEAFDTPAACTPNISVSGDSDIGDVCGDATSTTQLEVFNTGSSDLIINSIEKTSGSDEINLEDNPGLPLAIAAGAHVDFIVRCDGVTPGTKSATFRINSNDGDEPEFDVEFDCNTPEPVLNLAIADSGEFGEVCPLSHADLDLHLLNEGVCDLTVSGINMNPIGSNYELPVDLNYPLTIGPGSDFTVPVRFEPNPGQACSNAVLRTATLTVISDSTGPDPVIDLRGLMPCPDLNVAIADSGDFGKVCATEQSDLNLTLFNQGRCNLTIDNISSDNGLFELPGDIDYPLVLSHDADFNFPVRFSPNACSDDPVAGTLTIDSDSPGEEMLEIGVGGEIPCPNLEIDPGALTGAFAFAPTVMDLDGSLGCYTERSTAVRNTGDCPLTIQSITAADDFAVMIPTPDTFPIVLPPGEETLNVTVRFAPLSAGNPLAPTEFTGLLSIVSDDPDAAGEAELCGEGVAQSGIRVLTTENSSGLPLPVDEVDSITIRSKGKKTPSPINIQFTDVPVQTDSICGNTVAWHVDQETLPSTQTTGNNPKSSYEVSSKEGNLQDAQSFSLGQCDFFEFQLQLLDSGSESCALKQKGEACDNSGECCSGKCKGPNGGKTCK